MLDRTSPEQSQPSLGAALVLLSHRWPDRSRSAPAKESLYDRLARAGYRVIRCDGGRGIGEAHFLDTLRQNIDRRQGRLMRCRLYLSDRFVRLHSEQGVEKALQLLGQAPARSRLQMRIAALSRQKQNSVIVVDRFAPFVAGLFKRNYDDGSTFLHYFSNLCTEYPKVLWVFVDAFSSEHCQLPEAQDDDAVHLDTQALRRLSQAYLQYLQNIAEPDLETARQELSSK